MVNIFTLVLCLLGYSARDYMIKFKIIITVNIIVINVKSESVQCVGFVRVNL